MNIMKTIAILLILISPTLLADYEVEVRTDFTCSVNPKGMTLPTERFDNEADSIARTIELVDETQNYVTHRCYFTHRYNYVEPDPTPDPVSARLYTDLVRAPLGAPITGFCSDGSTETKPAIANMSLCGSAFAPEITAGQVIYASPPTIPQANAGDVIVLSAGTYTSTVNCGGRDTGWCGDGNNGVQIIGDIFGERPVIEGAYDCGAGAAGTQDLTLANVEAAVSCARRGTKTNTRFVNIYCHDKASRSSGACGNWSSTAKGRVFGFETLNTGVSRENNAHSLYHGGRGHSFDVEFGYITIRNHLGGAGFAVYGHTAGEVLEDIYIHDMLLDNACEMQGCLNVSHTDGQSGTPDERSWIDSVLVERVQCINGSDIEFRGANLNGGQDWAADDNDCPINSRMGGDPSSWVRVTNNTGAVTGNVR